ncbi:MAG: tetratricopeptide repeat protein [Planctomycetia bacterium]
MALNLLLATTLVWTEVEPFIGSIRITVWCVTGFLWGAICIFGWMRRDTRRTIPHDQRGDDDLMSEVQEYYLQRNWFEAEKRLKRMIRRNPRDVDARLILAGVLRRSDRPEAAAVQLDRIERLEGIDRWRWEIDRERRFLEDPSVSDESEQEEVGDDLDRPRAGCEFRMTDEVDDGFVNPAA